MKESAIVSKIG